MAVWHRDKLTKLAAYNTYIQHAPHMPSMSETGLSPVIESLPYIDIRWRHWRMHPGRFISADVNCSRRQRQVWYKKTLVSLKIYVITSSRRTQIFPSIGRRRGCDGWVWLWEPSVKERIKIWHGGSITFLPTNNTHHICLACQRQSLSPVIKSLPYIDISDLESEESGYTCQEWHCDNLAKLPAYNMHHICPVCRRQDLSPVIKSLPYTKISEPGVSPNGAWICWRIGR